MNLERSVTKFRKVQIGTDAKGLVNLHTVGEIQQKQAFADIMSLGSLCRCSTTDEPQGHPLVKNQFTLSCIIGVINTSEQIGVAVVPDQRLRRILNISNFGKSHKRITLQVFEI